MVDIYHIINLCIDTHPYADGRSTVLIAVVSDLALMLSA